MKHAQCDIGLACRDSGQWPYSAACLPLRSLGERCHSEHDCLMGSTCRYPSPRHVLNQTSVCMEAYGLPDGAVIGFHERYYKDLLYQNYFFNGQACQSMFAV